MNDLIKNNNVYRNKYISISLAIFSALIGVAYIWPCLFITSVPEWNFTPYTRIYFIIDPILPILKILVYFIFSILSFFFKIVQPFKIFIVISILNIVISSISIYWLYSVNKMDNTVIAPNIWQFFEFPPLFIFLILSTIAIFMAILFMNLAARKK